MILRHITCYFAALGLTMLFVSTSWASVDVCQQPPDASYVSVGYFKDQEASFEGGIGTNRQENFEFDLQFEAGDNWQLGAGHRYKILNIDGIVPETNGHLHTSFFPLHWEKQSARNSFRISIAPALSASSNVYRNFGEVDSDAWQLLAALIWSRPMSDRVIIRYGICGDHRFGEYTIYPSFIAEWQAHDDWTIELGFPMSRLTYDLSKSVTSSLRIAPDGNEWFVKDQSLTRQSQLIYEAYLLDWSFEWLAHEHFGVSASVGWQFDIRYEMTLLDTSRVRLSSESVMRIGAAVAWRF